MARSVKIDPLTRIEGHRAFRVDVESTRVAEAFCSGEMFRPPFRPRPVTLR